MKYPFSQLILSGTKTIVARRYALGHLNIAFAGEEQFLIEKYASHANAAILSVGPRPRRGAAQVVGTVTFATSTQYMSRAAWERDRQMHCIRKRSAYDWDGDGEMHAWHVAKVRRFKEPLPAGGTIRANCGFLALRVVWEGN